MEFYVCSTPYHLYVSLCRIVKEKNISYLYLTTHDENVYNLFTKWYDRLIKNEYVYDVLIRKRSNLKEKLFIENLKDTIEFNKIKHIIENATLINFAWHPYGLYSTSEYIFKKFNKSIFIEEGSNLYLKVKPSNKIQFIKKYFYRKNLEFYKDDKLLKILVQFPERYPQHLRPKISKLDLDEIFNEISKEDKQSIIDIFDTKLDLDIFFNDCIIILTQPLSEDGYITEEEKKSIFKGLVDKYRKNYKVILKKHPRENTKYNINDTIEIEGSFPSEIFRLLDIKFEKAIGVCTSAVNSINAKEAFNTDEDFFTKF